MTVKATYWYARRAPTILTRTLRILVRRGSFFMADRLREPQQISPHRALQQQHNIPAEYKPYAERRSIPFAINLRKRRELIRLQWLSNSKWRW